MLALLCAACGTTERRRPSQGADSSAVAALVHERLDAALAGDTAHWHQLVSDSCLFTGPALHVATTREVIASVAANRVLRPAAQQLRGLVVYVSGDLAQASYVQLVQDAGQGASGGTRFRKTDAFVRREGRWQLIGAAEVDVPFRPTIALDASQSSRLTGSYAPAAIDTLTVSTLPGGRLGMRGRDGLLDTLLAASDTSAFVDGDPGTWIFSTGPGGGVSALRYQRRGARDVLLPRVEVH